MLTCLTSIPPRLWQMNSSGRFGCRIITNSDKTGTQLWTGFMAYTRRTLIGHARQQVATQGEQIRVWDRAKKIRDSRIVPISQNPRVGKVLCQKVLRPVYDLWRWHPLSISLIRSFQISLTRCVPQVFFCRRRLTPRLRVRDRSICYCGSRPDAME